MGMQGSAAGLAQRISPPPGLKPAAWQSPVGKVDTGVKVAAFATSQESVSRGYGGGVT